MLIVWLSVLLRITRLLSKLKLLELKSLLLELESLLLELLLIQLRQNGLLLRSLRRLLMSCGLLNRLLKILKPSSRHSLLLLDENMRHLVLVALLYNRLGLLHSPEVLELLRLNLLHLMQ